MSWMPLDSLTEWENTWVWLKVTLPDRAYVYYKPINVCKYPGGTVMWGDPSDVVLDPNIHTIIPITLPNI